MSVGKALRSRVEMVVAGKEGKEERALPSLSFFVTTTIGTRAQAQAGRRPLDLESFPSTQRSTGLWL
jgi:hypothetical protein